MLIVTHFRLLPRARARPSQGGQERVSATNTIAIMPHVRHATQAAPAPTNVNGQVRGSPIKLARCATRSSIVAGTASNSSRQAWITAWTRCMRPRSYPRFRGAVQTDVAHKGGAFDECRQLEHVASTAERRTTKIPSASKSDGGSAPRTSIVPMSSLPVSLERHADQTLIDAAVNAAAAAAGVDSCCGRMASSVSSDTTDRRFELSCQSRSQRRLRRPTTSM